MMWQTLAIGLLGLATPSAADPLVPVPEGCTAPPPAHVVFVGEVVDRDYRTIRFEIERVRAGDPAPFGFDDNEIDVRYGLDAQYLDDGESYLVSAVVHPDLGLLISKVSDPIEHFGGDEVIGVSETDVECPVFENPMKTLHVDGTAIEADVLEPFFAAKPRLLAAVAVPVALACGAVFLLATFKLSIVGLFNSVFRPSRR
jgi:hypothetical protein